MRDSSFAQYKAIVCWRKTIIKVMLFTHMNWISVNLTVSIQFMTSFNSHLCLIIFQTQKEMNTISISIFPFRIKKNNVFSTLGISALALNISVTITEGKGMQTQDWMREFSTMYLHIERKVSWEVITEWKEHMLTTPFTLTLSVPVLDVHKGS